jgi:hypothetical protein
MHIPLILINLTAEEKDIRVIAVKIGMGRNWPQKVHKFDVNSLQVCPLQYCL